MTVCYDQLHSDSQKVLCISQAETYYATEANVSFAAPGGADLKASVEKEGGVHVSGSAAVQWTSKKSFTITQNDAVPFGFRGWKV